MVGALDSCAPDGECDQLAQLKHVARTLDTWLKRWQAKRRAKRHHCARAQLADGGQRDVHVHLRAPASTQTCGVGFNQLSSRFAC
eukprot:2373103-Prymnesium_polylepis.1